MGCVGLHVICLLCVAFQLQKELIVHSILQGNSDLKKAFICQFREMRSLWTVTILKGRDAWMSHNQENLINFQGAFFTLMYTPLEIILCVVSYYCVLFLYFTHKHLP